MTEAGFMKATEGCGRCGRTFTLAGGSDCGDPVCTFSRQALRWQPGEPVPLAEPPAVNLTLKEAMGLCPGPIEFRERLPDPPQALLDARTLAAYAVNLANGAVLAEFEIVHLVDVALRHGMATCSAQVFRDTQAARLATVRDAALWREHRCPPARGLWATLAALWNSRQRGARGLRHAISSKGGAAGQATDSPTHRAPQAQQTANKG